MFSKYKKKSPPLEIGMTPMIDIVFLLLIFFMLTSTFIQTASINVDLPETTSSDGSQELEYVITLHQNGTITYNEQSTDLEHLDSQLKALKVQDPNATLIIQGDTGIAYGDLIQIMDLARNNGLTKLSLSTVLRQ